MYFIARTKDFEKSYRKLQRSGYLKASAKDTLTEAIRLLATGEKLPLAYNDHQLTGALRPYRECHIRGDLLLVYQIHKDELLLILVDLGTHSYLGL